MDAGPHPEAEVSAERQRRYRERKGARVGGPPGPAPSAPCGEPSAYRRHLRHGEPACDACKAGWAKYNRERKKKP